jgi:glycosyltransferase involved in cell wall biosynthesis
VMGRPVIAANHGGVTETVLDGKTGWLAPVGDADAWAAALAEAIDVGASRRAEMGDLGRKRARQLYSVEAMCAATLSAYEQVLEARA